VGERKGLNILSISAGVQVRREKRTPNKRIVWGAEASERKGAKTRGKKEAATLFLLAFMKKGKGAGKKTSPRYHEKIVQLRHRARKEESRRSPKHQTRLMRGLPIPHEEKERKGKATLGTPTQDMEEKSKSNAYK